MTADKTTAPELLPCPFCGGKGYDHGPYSAPRISALAGNVNCTSCGSTAHRDFWNRRTDLCASGQVRALDRAVGDDRKAGWTLPVGDLSAIKLHVYQEDGEVVSLESVEVIAIEVERRILAALTPAPQPEGQVHRISELRAAIVTASDMLSRHREQFLDSDEPDPEDDSLRQIEAHLQGAMIGDNKAAFASAPTPATPTAQEAVPVGIAGNMPGSNGGFTTAVFKASDVPEGSALFTHPPRPSETVAEALAEKLARADIEELKRQLWNMTEAAKDRLADVERLTKERDELDGANIVNRSAIRLQKQAREKVEAERDEAYGEIATLQNQLAEARAQVARLSDIADTIDRCFAGNETGESRILIDGEWHSGPVAAECERIIKAIRDLIRMRVGAPSVSLEAYGREKVREGMKRAADIGWVMAERDDIRGAILAEIEKLK